MSIFDNAGNESGERRTRAAAIADELGREIYAGTIPPGTKLTEEVLAERFGVSRGPIREALGLLARDDLVAIRPHLGAIVPKLTLEEVADLFDVRAALFSAATRLFTKQLANGFLNDEVMAEFAAISDRLDTRASAPAEEFAQLSQEASMFFLDHCGNAKLRQQLIRINRQSYMYYLVMGHQDMEHRQRFMTLGRMMRDAVLVQEPELAAIIAFKLVEANKQAVYDQYQRLKDDQAAGFDDVG